MTTTVPYNFTGPLAPGQVRASAPLPANVAGPLAPGQTRAPAVPVVPTAPANNSNNNSNPYNFADLVKPFASLATPFSAVVGKPAMPNLPTPLAPHPIGPTIQPKGVVSGASTINTAPPVNITKALASGGLTLDNAVPTVAPTVTAPPTPPPPVTSSPQVATDGTLINGNTGGAIPNTGPDVTVQGGATPPPTDSPAAGIPGVGSYYNSPEYKKALKDYTDSLAMTTDEQTNTQKINDLEASLALGEANTSNQPIPMEFITGQKKAEQDRTLALEKPLEAKAALLQAKRTAAQDASKFTLDQLTSKYAFEKPTMTTDAFGNPVAFSPITGKTTAVPGIGGDTTGKPGTLSFQQYGLLANTNFNPGDQTDQIAQLYLDKYLKSGSIPTASTLGRAIKPGALAAVDQRARDLYFQATGSPMPNPEIIQGYEKIINANNTFANNLKTQEGTVKANFGVNLENLSANDLNTSGINSVNTFLDNIKQFWLGNPEAAQYALQNATLQNEIGSLLAVRNASGTTVHDKLEAAGLIPKGASLDQQKAMLKTLLTEADNAKTSIASASADIYKQIDPLLQDSNNPLRALGNPKDSASQDPLGLGFNQGSGGTPTATTVKPAVAGMRTDRNNNPTAMTTDVAKSLGLVAGKDYVQGDPFKTSTGQTLYTAKILGDPVATTIKGIDQGGFFTASGKPRWSYISMSQANWNKLSYAQKASVVKQMYQNEGGVAMKSAFNTA